MKRSILFAILTIPFLFGTAYADLLSLLDDPPDIANDALQDRSWGVQDGNVIYGLAAFDTITVNFENIEVHRSAWFVFSLTVDQAIDTNNDKVVDYYTHVPTASGLYTLQNLVDSSIPSNALLVLIDGINYSSTNYLQYLQDDSAAPKDLIDKAIAELKGNGTPVAAFGLLDAVDYFHYYPIEGEERFGLSAVWAATNVAYFLPLYPEDDSYHDLREFEFSTRTPAEVTATSKYNSSYETIYTEYLGEPVPVESGYTYYVDKTTALVNYVPEPVSLVGLTGLLLVGGGLGLLRRRRK